MRVQFEPKFVKRILDNRNSSGTWGEDIHPQNELLHTTAALYYLSHVYNQNQDQRLKETIESAANQINRMLASCAVSKLHDLVGFEYIFPSLLHLLGESLRQEFSFQIEISPKALNYLRKIDEIGINKIMGLIQKFKTPFPQSIPTTFSAEAIVFMHRRGLIKDKDFIRYISSLEIDPIAGLSNSIAATLAIANSLQKYNITIPSSYFSFIELIDKIDLNGYPGTHPNRGFSLIWPAVNWLSSGRFSELMQVPTIRKQYADYINSLEDLDSGQSWDWSSSNFVDLDSTCMTYAVYLLLKQSYPVMIKTDMTLAAVKKFRMEDGKFFCYPFEKDSSPSHFLHLLTLLEIIEKSDLDQKLKEEALGMQDALITQLMGYKFEDFIKDKWHISELYNLSAISSSPKIMSSMPELFMSSILHTIESYKDGGWSYKGTANIEETALGIITLTNAIANAGNVLDAKLRAKIVKRIDSGRKNLLELLKINDSNSPGLWMSKTTFVPFITFFSNATLALVTADIDKQRD
jgi:hypothetical protein